MPYEYKMMQVPPNITVKSREHQGNEAAYYLQSIANEQAAGGWEFYRVDAVGVTLQPGCLGALFGQKAAQLQYYVITFRKDGQL
jgi:hypothetical protein